jgi:type I restriction enzyme M protein
VFNPYSGVKTSIVLLDRQIASKSDGAHGAVLFVKIENDGLALGAQRREIDKNDLPDALKVIGKFQKSPGMRTAGSTRMNANNVLVVAKNTIAENGEYNLTGERYRVVERRGKQKWEMVRLGDVCTLVSDTIDPQSCHGIVEYIGLENIESGSGKIIGETLTQYTEIKSLKNIFSKSDILYGKLRPNLNKVYLAQFSGICSTDIYVLRASEKILPALLNIYLRDPDFNQQIVKGVSGSQLPRVKFDYLSKLQIPLPSIEIQQKIVAEIEGYQKIIDGARQVIDNWKPQIEVDPEWPMVKLGDVCEDFKNGLNFSADQVGNGIKFVNIKDVFSDGYVDIRNLEKVEISKKEKTTRIVSDDDLLFVRSSVKYEGVGFPSLVNTNNEEIVFCGFIIKCTPNKDIVLPKYLLFLLRTTEYRNKTVFLSNKANITNISQDSLKSLEIPLPPIDIQQDIVAKIEAEWKVLVGCRELMIGYEGKIKRVVDGVWRE